MHVLDYKRKIKIFSILSLILPLLAINFCLYVFITLASIEINIDYIDWDKKYISYNTTNEVSEKENNSYTLWYPEKFDWEDKYLFYNVSNSDELFKKNEKKYSFTNCSKYEFEQYLVLSDKSKILATKNNSNIIQQAFNNKEVIALSIKKKSTKNNRCVKNKVILNKILLSLPFLEKILIDGKINNASGFTKVRSPYLYGEVSISRTARYFPVNFVFKPLLILSAVFLFLYWKNNLNLFKSLNNQNIITNFSKNFFYFGSFSALFLVLHAIFLGINFESKIFLNFRRLIIILFIVFEIIAQFMLTINLFKVKEKIIQHINPLILKIKIWFVVSILLITITSLIYLIFLNPTYNFKNILEWNYFTFLLLYYFLTRLMWK